MEHTIPKALVFVVALAFGAVLAGPFIVAGGPFYPELVNDQNYYLARIQEVREGHLVSGNPYLAEYQGIAPVSVSLGEYILALLPQSLPLYALIFGPIIFLLGYATARRLGAPRSFALMATLLICCGTYFFTYARPISPQFNLIFWLATVLGLFSMAERPTWRWAALQAAIIGALFYLYPYYWTHLLAVYGLVFLIYRSPKILALGVGAAALGSGALWLSFAARGLAYYDESLARLGFIATHTPSGVGVALASSVLVAAGLWRAWKQKRMTRTLILAASLVMGGVIAMNQHLVTGANMEFSSHYGPLIVIADIFFALAVISTFEWWPALSKNWVRIPAFVLLVLWCAPFVASPYLFAEKQKGTDAAYAPVMKWLKANTEPDQVVYAPEELSVMIPAYTEANVLYARAANFGLMPDTDVVDRFIIQNYGADFSKDFIREHERALFGVRYVNAYEHARQKQRFLKLIGLTMPVPERLPAEAITRVQSRAAELQARPLASLLAPYRVAYLVAPAGENPLGTLVPVFSAGGFEVFKNPI